MKAATDAYKAALEATNYVTLLEVPEVKTTDLTNKASKISDEAELIRRDAESMITENDELLRGTTQIRYELQQVLNDAMAQQVNVDRQMQV